MKNLIISVFLLALMACDTEGKGVVADSGATKVSVQVQKDVNGMTVEQKNVADRLLLDNKPGSIKHLYILSSYTGQAIIYSTVKGKVTSSGKRLTPTSVVVQSESRHLKGFETVGGRQTSEVIQDDGTYGSSIEYLFWWDVKGIYHQHYISGGQIVHISDQPIPVKSVTINMELTK